MYLGLGLTGIFPKPELFRSWFGRFEFIFTRMEGLNHEEVATTGTGHWKIYIYIINPPLPNPERS